MLADDDPEMKREKKCHAFTFNMQQGVEKKRIEEREGEREKKI